MLPQTAAHAQTAAAPALKSPAAAPSATGPATPGMGTSTAVTSPDQRLQLKFSVLDTVPDTSGRLVYSVLYNGKPLLEDSGLSLKLAGAPPLGENVRITEATPSSGVDDYDQISGTASHVHDAYNSITVTVSEPDNPGRGTPRTLSIEARAYNGAVAFRYVVPEPPGANGQYYQRMLRLEEERTQFNFDRDASTWALELPNFRSAYESEFIPLSISAFSSQGGAPTRLLVGLPLLTHIPGQAWLAITEADLETNSVMYLTGGPADFPSQKAQFHLQTVVAPRFDDPPSDPSIAVIGRLPHHSAWRVLEVADTPAALTELNVVNDLNPPSVLTDTSWIHPGKSAWGWWNGNAGADGKSANTTAGLEYFVDFAAASGFPYMLVDGGWSEPDDITKPNSRVDVPAIVQYAAAKNVKVWIWTHYTPTVLQMDAAFPIYEKWGVAGVKIDFIQRGDQTGIEWYYRAARLAAAHHLMLDYHGTTTPWGISRTYPNVMGYEGVLGMENSKWSTRDNPVSHTTLPFTRMLSGPMDYTPGGFGNATEETFVARNFRPMVLGTRAQQLALYVLYFAPIQMVADAPAAYQGQPEFQFIKDVPATWDETRGLQGKPGESATIARRSGHDWFIGSISNWTPRDIAIPLNFLGPGKYTAEIYRDANDADQNPQHVTIEKKSVRQSDTLALHLASGGGAAIRLRPAS
ncbi:MAG TPA: glycoside hydrolase family 97 protein [Acidisarcina sp.]